MRSAQTNEQLIHQSESTAEQKKNGNERAVKMEKLEKFCRLLSVCSNEFGIPKSATEKKIFYTSRTSFFLCISFASSMSSSLKYFYCLNFAQCTSTFVLVYRSTAWTSAATLMMILLVFQVDDEGNSMKNDKFITKFSYMCHVWFAT